MITVRRVGLAEAPAFRSLRLVALRDHPADFGSDAASEASLPLSHFVGQLADNHVMGAYVEGRLAGIMALLFHTKAKERHRAYLWGVYVSPHARGRSVAPGLLDATLDAAFAVAEQVELGVRADNRAAAGLYRSRGFVPCGGLPAIHRVDGTDHDDTMMVLTRAGYQASRAGG
jgi:ribosomal protein S18 acetylase RimI-like enzyme